MRPYLDAGIGTNDGTNETAFLGAIGLRTEFIFPSGDYIYGLTPGLLFSVNTGQSNRRDNVLSPVIEVSARRALGFQIAGYEPDAGVYFDGGYDFQSFELASVSATSDNVNINLEVGAGFGFSRARPRILGLFQVPRLRVGYRFGDVSGFRIRIGGRSGSSPPR